MKTTITGKDMVISNAISERVLKKTAKMERYLDPNTELLVRLTKKRTAAGNARSRFPLRA